MAARMYLGALLVVHAALGFAEPDPALLPKLRQGGYVLFLRHTSTDFSKNDQKMTSFEDCANQRNLTDKGRAEARALGEALERLTIPIGPVYASPFCRTMETARLAFGRAERMNEARGGPTNDPSRYELLRKLLATPPPGDANAVVSSHGNPFYALYGPPYLAEGEIAIIRPDGANGPEVVGRVRLEDWPALR
ncbi:MAG: histidine phosphatase family protein [Burkholderiales bacterium]